MAELPDLQDLLTKMLDAASTAIGDDINSIRTFSKQQATDIAALTIDIYDMIENDELDDTEREQYLRILRNLIDNLTHTIAALGQLTVEKALNAIVEVLWSTLDKATGFKLPRP